MRAWRSQKSQKHTYLADQFNIPQYSDFQVKINEPESEDSATYYLHRLLICNQSEYFASALRSGMEEAQEGVITVQENHYYFSTLLKLFYSQDFDGLDDDDYVPLIQLADKYCIQEFTNKLVNALCGKLSADNVFACLDLKLERFPKLKEEFLRTTSLKSVLSNDNFLDIGRRKIKNLLKLLTNSSNTKDAVPVLLAWLQKSTNRSKFARELLSTIQKRSNLPPRFYFQRNTLSTLKFREFFTSVENTENEEQRVLGTRRTNHFKVKILSGRVFVGLAGSIKFHSTRNEVGLFLDVYVGETFSGKFGSHRTDYMNEILLEGDDSEIEVIQDDGEIRFIVNGTDEGVAFENAELLYPAFILSPNSKVQMIQ